jgi:hypothetical protein
MPKKTSRAARSQQNQRFVRDVSQKKVESARPLVNSASAVAEGENSISELTATTTTDIRTEVPQLDLSTPVVPTINRPVTRSRVVPASRRAASNTPAISRDQEYDFIRSDLRTVLILTVLMIIVLVILTFVIGR